MVKKSFCFVFCWQLFSVDIISLPTNEHWPSPLLPLQCLYSHGLHGAITEDMLMHAFLLKKTKKTLVHQEGLDPSASGS
jgi:hypothetical protein